MIKNTKEISNEIIEDFIEKYRGKTNIVGDPGYWCEKLEDWINQQDKPLEFHFDFNQGELHIEDIAKELYELFTGTKKSIDISDEEI